MPKLRTLLVMAATAVVAGSLRISRRPLDTRKARYAEALPYLTRVFADIAKFECVSGIEVRDDIEQVCKAIVNRLAAAFSLITGTKCSACIKTYIDGPGEERPRVATLCRDDASLEREQGPSPLEAWIQYLQNPETVSHWIDENTAYRQFFGRESTPQRCYFSNDLPAEPHYHNTSFKIYGDPPEPDDPTIREHHWPLPYKSTIVAPIGRLTIPGNHYDLVGFLAVDSRSRDVFSKQYDIDLTLGVADSLFNLVDAHLQLLHAEIQAEQGGDDEEEGTGEN